VLGLTPEPARLQPKFLRNGDGKGRGRQAVVLHLSDLHVGETVNREEVANVNSYDIDIARKRIGRLFETACVLMTSAWPASDGAPERVNVLLGGDLISGHGLHPEHAETDGGTAFEQVKFAAEYISAGILRLHLDSLIEYMRLTMPDPQDPGRRHAERNTRSRPRRGFSARSWRRSSGASPTASASASRSARRWARARSSRAARRRG
jgi:hypothetical protein